MDTIRYMSIYSQTYAAMESFDSDWPSIALEAVNVNNEVDSLMNSLNERLSRATATLNAAYDAKDWKKAHAAVDEMEKCIVEWRNKLRSIPDESKWRKGLKVTAKIAASVGAAVVIFHSDKLRSTFMQGLQMLKVPDGAAKHVASSINGTIQGTAIRTIVGGVKSIFGKIMGDGDKHSDNKRYMAAHASLDNWQKVCKETRFAIYEEERQAKGGK